MRVQQHFSVEDLGTFRTKLLKEVATQTRLFRFATAKREQEKADHALHLMMNYYAHQLEF